VAQPAARLRPFLRGGAGVLVALLLALGGAVRAQPAAGTEPAPSTQDWLTYFYMERDTAPLVRVLRDLAGDGVLGPGSAEGPLASFFSEIFRANPERAVAWIREAELTPPQRLPLIKALWLAGLKYEAVKLARLDDWPAGDLAKLDKPPPDRFSFSISDPSHLDMMWAGFMATGDVRYVRRVIGVLEYEPAEEDGGLAVLLLRSSARWSLATNADQHELVYRAVKEEAERRAGLAQEVLRDIAGEVARQAPSFPSRDGDFSAMLFVTDDLEFRNRWANLPISEMPQVRSVERVPKGRLVEVELVFTGNGLDADLRADVAYDVEILRPDGGVYAELPNLTGIKGRRPSRFMVNLAYSTVQIEFDPPDPVGVYTVKVKLRDLVGKRKLDLSVPIEAVAE